MLPYTTYLILNLQWMTPTRQRYSDQMATQFFYVPDVAESWMPSMSLFAVVCAEVDTARRLGPDRNSHTLSNPSICTNARLVIHGRSTSYILQSSSPNRSVQVRQRPSWLSNPNHPRACRNFFP